MVAANKKEMTLQEIGDIFNLTRMRICQIEKIIFAKINSKLKNHDVATL
jgi:DNA-directed RNA polymerase sigma subunit (sigma70/sigma32)